MKQAFVSISWISNFIYSRGKKNPTHPYAHTHTLHCDPMQNVSSLLTHIGQPEVVLLQSLCLQGGLHYHRAILVTGKQW